MASNRLTGHGLVYEGWAYTTEGVQARYRNEAGMGRCSCGTYSPRIANTAQRKRWHADHKDDIRAGGTGIVWQDRT